MYQWLKDLFPLNRSITGEGNRLTIEYFKRINPELKNIKFKSGTKVFDWIVPLEWNVKDAYIEHVKSRKKFAEFKKNNLHLVGYSYPLNKIIDLNKFKNSGYDNKIVCIENADPGFDFIFTKKIIGLITKFGGANSHMAIRCAEFGIPAAIGVGEEIYNSLKNKKYITLDCLNKKIY